jgi:two-component system response regulator VicR
MEKKKRILIVEDEKDIAEILQYNVCKQGYEAEVANDGEKGLALALSGTFDLILLDVMLPKTDGFTVCKKIREKSNVPIIMLTAREEEVDKVLGLELGADDYMTKPFSLRELMARVKANLRRTQTAMNADAGNDIMTFGDLTIDTEKYEVRK